MRYSIITPVHNSFNYMGRLLNSLKQQTFREFELLLVDDASFEADYNKMERCLSRSGLNYRLIRLQKNVGPGQARNIGIEAAKGEFVIFVDSDDYLSKNALFEINRIQECSATDLILFDYVMVCREKKKYRKTMRLSCAGTVGTAAALVSMNNAPWGRVYRKSLLTDSVRFPDLLLAEDWVFNVRYAQNCSHVLYVNKPLYYYVTHADSLVSRYSGEEFRYGALAYEIIKRELKKEYLPILPALAGRELVYPLVKGMLSTGAGAEEVYHAVADLERSYGAWYEKEYIKYLPANVSVVLWAVKKRSSALLRILKKVLFHG